MCWGYKGRADIRTQAGPQEAYNLVEGIVQ